MTKEQLARAKTLEKEIVTLESFINTADMCWRGELEVNRKRLLFSNIPYGWVQRETLECNTTLKNRIRDVVVNYMYELKEELENL